ncbi:unnamed protein product [Acanthoscelides obtectus]|uniref:Pseudouridine-5'-phosphate glycosidase n=1 Tax=Acanthoscelides obtectus TaxID=200917 RepID=A0A9P0JUQ8_ACAOB|nr:unnamed protein product [Acanthoscelides obtectus]CAK1625222.1 Pseudouridine-5'-phosphate glycosidase [Acanthoscelides obtectus]
MSCYRTLNKISKNHFLILRRFLRTNVISNPHIKVSEEVQDAIECKKPVVALESTIITHGMPYPKNVVCAVQVEGVVRKQGAIPATIAIIRGKIHVGLSETDINMLGDTSSSKPIKTSRRDLAYVISNEMSGGTTVCGTILVADQVGIPVFATGGIGGVHRGADKTFDVSADLIELGKSGIAVISSGVKSILDIPKTLEYLETQGVFVGTFGDSNEFPAFYSRKSGSKSPYIVQSAKKAAQIIKSSMDMDLKSGMLFAVPIPEKYALSYETMNEVIEQALKSMDPHMEGKQVTPYLLSQVAKLTSGKSLESSIL